VTPLLALVLAAAPQSSAKPPPVPPRFSILVDPCARASDTAGRDVVVCGKGPTPRLPLPDERGPPDHPVASNPELSGAGALAAQGTPCAARQGGCTVGFGGPVVAAAVNGLVTTVSDGLKDRHDRAARRRDAGRRVAIPLDDGPTS
jgi:hypothetical protein